MLVESLAYQYTRKPPKTIKPRDNVLIRLCTIECSYIQPLDGEQNQKFAADIEGWSKLAKYLFIWDYTTNYNDYLGPHPNLRVLAPNVRYFVKHGAIGLFEEGEGDDFCELKNWLLLRVMWEPNLDGEKLIGEFLSGYYGLEVAPLLKRYWDVLIARAEKEKIYLGCFCMNSAKWIDLATLYRVRKFARRNRVALGVAATVAVLLVALAAGVGTAAYAQVNVRARKAEAEIARRDAKESETKRRIAEEERQKSVQKAKDLEWLRNTALPGVQKLKDDRHWTEAFALARQARSKFPDDPAVLQCWQEVSKHLVGRQRSARRRVTVRPYGDAEKRWEVLGTTPLNRVAVAHGFYHWRIEKDGFELVEGCGGPGAGT